MKKIIILFIMIFLLSGCSAEYYAIFSKEDVKESIYLNDEELIPWQTPAYIDDQGSSEENIKIEGIEYYNIENNQNNLVYKYNFPFNNYSKSRAINTCFKSAKLTKDSNNNYILNTSNYNSCFDLYNMTNITINLSFLPSDFEVISNNADRINNNVYIWDINQSNYQNKYIQVIFKEKKDEEENPSNPSNPSNPNNPGEINIEKELSNQEIIVYLILGFISLIAIIVIVVKFKNRKYK